MTSKAGSVELKALGHQLIEAVSELEAQLAPVDDVSHMQHHDFCHHAYHFGNYLRASQQLGEAKLFAQAFAMLRCALERWVIDAVAFVGDRFVEIRTDIDEDAFEQLERAWFAGDVPDLLDEPTRTNKGRTRLVWRGLVASNDSSMVIHPLYFTAGQFDPFFGTPSMQEHLVSPWHSDDEAREMARNTRARYQSLLAWPSATESLILNRVVEPEYEIQLRVHYMFLSAFNHAQHSALKLLAEVPYELGVDIWEHAKSELVDLYVAAIGVRYLESFLEMTSRQPEVGLRNRTELLALAARCRRDSQHLWFLHDSPTDYDYAVEHLARQIASVLEQGTKAEAPAPLDLKGSEVGYNRNPLLRLAEMHLPSNKFMRRQPYVPVWGPLEP